MMKRPRSFGALLAALAVAALLIYVEDDGSLAGRRALAANSNANATHATAHTSDDDDNVLCIATVADDTISSAAIVDAGGEFSLALPDKYEAAATIECTRTDPKTGTMTLESRTTRTVTGTEANERTGEGCDRKAFRPGYFDHGTSTWHDPCSDAAPDSGGDAASGQRGGVLSPKNCPVVNAKKDLWIHFVGDSVTRGLLLAGLRRAGVNLKQHAGAQHWSIGLGNPPDALLRGIDVGDGRNVWITFAFDFMHGGAAMVTPLPRNWGEFLQHRSTPAARARKEQLALGSPFNTKDDPLFGPDRAPDVVVWSPGYHASKASAEEFCAGMEEVLNEWRRKMDEVGSPMPRMLFPLNFMPAYWMIPRKHADDVPHRTVLNEHRKNLAILDVANKFDFVSGVVDFNSVELNFHGGPGQPSAHRDAVHISHHHVVMRVTADMILKAICRTQLDPLQMEADLA